MLIAALPKLIASYTLVVTTSVGSTAHGGFSTGEVCARIRDAAPAAIQAKSTTGVRVLRARCWPIHVGEELHLGTEPAPTDGGGA